jgi:hypothetical protein
LQGKSMNMADYSGDIKVKKWGKAAARQPKLNKYMAEYQGNVVIAARENKKQEYEYKPKKQHNYTGEINQKKYVKWIDSRKGHTKAMASFQGNFKVTGKKEQQFEYMSKVAHNYSGKDRIKSNYARDKYFRTVSERNQQIIGNYRVKTRLARDIEQQITSAKVHNYQGGPKVSLFTRIWLSLFDNTGKLDKIDDKSKKPDYDTREYKIWN